MSTDNYLGDLKSQLVQATGRANEAQRERGGRWRRYVAGAAAMLVLAPVAGAAAGVWHPWTEPDGIARFTPDSVVAEGALADGGRWRLTASESSAGACLELHLDHAAPGLPVKAGGCGDRTRSVASIQATPPAAGVVFGAMPIAAESASLVIDGKTALVSGAAYLHAGETFYVLQPRAPLSHGCVIGLDHDGAVVQKRPVVAASDACHDN